MKYKVEVSDDIFVDTYEVVLRLERDVDDIKEYPEGIILCKCIFGFTSGGAVKLNSIIVKREEIIYYTKSKEEAHSKELEEKLMLKWDVVVQQNKYHLEEQVSKIQDEINMWEDSKSAYRPYKINKILNNL